MHASLCLGLVYILVGPQTAGCVPNPITYTILLNFFGREGRYDKVSKLFLKMKVSSMGLDVGTYNILIDVFGEGGYYKEVITLFNDMVDGNIEHNMETYKGLIVSRMDECSVLGNNDSFNGVIKAFRQAGQFEGTIKAYIDMEKGKCFPGERPLEAVLSVYCFTALVDESEELFQEIENMVQLPSVMSCYMMLGVYAKSER